MDEKRDADAMDEIVDGVRGWSPQTDVEGLRITGRILRLARYLEAAREETLGEYGLSVGDFDMLATLRRRAVDDAIKIRDLQQSLMLSSGGTTKRLDRLENAGLIERHPDPHDRRGTLITLSPQGFELISAAVPAVVEREARFVAESVGSKRNRAATESSLRQMLIACETTSAAAP